MHLDAGDTPEQALRRELLEETSWQPNELEFCMVHHIQGSVKPSVQA
jgi:8-oxo-dGTP pyrophosphatase MutT (NUDIX family)